MQVFLAGGNGIKPEKKKAKFATQDERAQITPWVEKYRPKKMDDVASQTEVVALLKKCVLLSNELPNILLYGPPGTGKTSVILACCRELFGPDFSKRVLELNASDERGIQVIRQKVKDFSRVAVTNKLSNGKDCMPVKIVILDEADSMTNAAQAALRRTMESETKTTRFCLICNYISRIIEPITSRTAKFRFKPLDVEVQSTKIKHICKQENVSIDDDALIRLIEISEGDLRRSITLLQSAHRYTNAIVADNIDDDPMEGSENKNVRVTAALINELAGVIPEEAISAFISAVKTGSYDKLDYAVEQLYREGRAGYQLINQIFDRIMTDDLQLGTMSKAKTLALIGLCEARLMDGASEKLQLLDLGNLMMRECKKTISA